MIGQGLAAFLTSVVAFVYVRWQKNCGLAYARLLYLWVRLLPWQRSRPWVLRPRAYMVIFAIGTFALVLFALALWGAFLVRVHATLTGSAAVAPVTSTQSPPAAAPPGSAVLPSLWFPSAMLPSVLFLAMGTWLLWRRRHGARFLKWLLDTGIPVETPPPRGELEPLRRGWVSGVTAIAFALICLGIAIAIADLT